MQFCACAYWLQLRPGDASKKDTADTAVNDHTSHSDEIELGNI